MTGLFGDRDSSGRRDGETIGDGIDWAGMFARPRLR